MKNIVMILITGLATMLIAISSYAAEITGVDIHGFVSQGYLIGNENDFTKDDQMSDFAFNEVGINFGKQLTETLRFGIQLFSRDFGDTGNNDIKVDWAFADYRLHELLGLRVGQIKTPHGLYNDIRDIDMLRNPIFLPDSVYQELSHDLYIQDIYLSIQGISSRDLYLSLQGIGLYGYLDLGMLGGFSYQAAYGTQNIDSNKEIGQRHLGNFTDLVPSNVIPSDSIETDGIDVDYKYAGNVVWDMPLDGLRLGVSLDNVQLTANSHFTRDIQIELPLGGGTFTLAEAGDPGTVEYKKLENWVYSVEYSWENLMVMAEYIQTEKDYYIDLSAIQERRKSNPYGWYVGGAYRFSDWFELGSYYSQSRNDEVLLDSFLPSPDFFKKLDDICLTARFDINEFWAIKLEAHEFRGTYILPISDNIYDVEYKNVEENWNLFVAKMTVAF